MTEYTYDVQIDLKDGATEAGGRITMIGETYGDLTDNDATSLALNELEPQGDFYRFRHLAFPRANFRAIRVSLVQVSDLSAAEPTPDA